MSIENPEEYSGYYFNTNKRVEDLTDDELECEIEVADEEERYAEEGGHGISTKEAVRHRYAKLEKGRRAAGIMPGAPIEEVAKMVRLVS